MNLEIISSNKSFGGWHKRYRHHASVLGCEMNFAIYLPPQALTGQKVPVLYWLSGRPAYRRRARHRPGSAGHQPPRRRRGRRSRL